MSQLFDSFCKYSTTRTGIAALMQLLLLLLVVSNRFPVSSGSSHLPLLMNLLRTYQVNACDNENLFLECDSRTVVAMTEAWYGKSPPARHKCRSFFRPHQQQLHHQPDDLMLRNDSPSLGLDYPLGPSAARFAKNRDRSRTGTISTAAAGAAANRNTKLISAHKLPGDVAECSEAGKLRYYFMTKVEATCREQHNCSITVNPTSIGLPNDPCPDMIKYGEVQYKCRPNMFRNKIICEGESIKLSCNEDDRIVILSGFFGAATNDVYECPQPRLNDTIGGVGTMPGADCTVNDTTQTIMKQCHGKRRCTLSASTDHFGTPSCGGTTSHIVRLRYHLKVVFTCISKKMLMQSTIGGIDDSTSATTTTTMMPISITANAATSTSTNTVIEAKTSTTTTTTISSSSSSSFENETEANATSMSSSSSSSDWAVANTHPLMDASGFDKSVSGNRDSRRAQGSKSRSSDVAPAIGGAEMSHINCTVLPASMQVIGFVSDWISAVTFLKNNKERFILYLMMSLLGSLVCFLIVLSVKLYHRKLVVTRQARAAQPPAPPFDFDDDDLDDYDDPLDPNRLPPIPETFVSGTPCGTTGTAGRHYTFQVPQNTPPLSILASSEPRPLLYSTLRKKSALRKSPRATVSYVDSFGSGGDGGGNDRCGGDGAIIVEPWTTTYARTSSGGNRQQSPKLATTEFHHNISNNHIINNNNNDNIITHNHYQQQQQQQQLQQQLRHHQHHPNYAAMMAPHATNSDYQRMTNVTNTNTLPKSILANRSSVPNSALSTLLPRPMLMTDAATNTPADGVVSPPTPICIPTINPVTTIITNTVTTTTMTPNIAVNQRDDDDQAASERDQSSSKSKSLSKSLNDFYI